MCCMDSLTVIEVCAGAGGQSIGFENAGFEHIAAVDIEPFACQTLTGNRPKWTVLEADIAQLDGFQFRGVDILAGGLPCPPFSVAGKQLGESDERNLFPHMVRLVREVLPVGVMIENVPGFASDKFRGYREQIMRELAAVGYETAWKLLNASDFGVPQLRPRFVMVALRPPFHQRFRWPSVKPLRRTVGSTILDLISERGWPGASTWAKAADSIAPTIVGGSKKHGGPDLGPTRARKQWLRLRVDGLGVADAAPSPDFPLGGCPKLTTRMIARIQAFPDDWCFAGGKTAACRQIGNAFPPPVAEAVASAVNGALNQRLVTAG